MTKEEQHIPLVSVILCTFNRATLVPTAVRSVFGQTYRRWELIVVDDGSRDGSDQVLLPLLKNEPRAAYIRHANRGLARSRNAGLRIASGTYVTFLDSDDEYLPRHLERRIRFLESRKEVAAVWGGIRIIGPKSRQYVPDVDRPGKKIHASHCHMAGTLVARRSCLAALKGFRDIVYSEDFDLISRMEKRYKVVKVSAPTYVYHVDAPNRLSDLYLSEGEGGIIRFRTGA